VETASVARARPRLLALSFAALSCVAGGMLDASTSAIRWARGGAGLTGTELVLTAAGVLALLIAPSIAWVRFVRERVWPNTPRTIEVAARLNRILVVGLVAYGTLALGLRVVRGFAHDAAASATEPRDAIVLFAGAAGAAATAWWIERMRR